MTIAARRALIIVGVGAVGCAIPLLRRALSTAPTTQRDGGEHAHTAAVREQFARQADSFSAHATRRYARDVMPWVMSQLPLPVDGGDVLDVAAGTGLLARSIARALDGNRVVALDATPEMLEAGQDQGKEDGTANLVDWVQGDAGALPFANDTFALVACRLAVHHFPADAVQDYITEMARVTRPGGAVALIDIVAQEGIRSGAIGAGADPGRLRRDWVERRRDPTHTVTQSPAGLAALLRGAGLRVASGAGASQAPPATLEVPLHVGDWLALTRASDSARRDCEAAFEEEVAEARESGAAPLAHHTGMRPFYGGEGGDELHFLHDWCVALGTKEA